MPIQKASKQVFLDGSLRETSLDRECLLESIGLDPTPTYDRTILYYHDTDNKETPRRRRRRPPWGEVGHERGGVTVLVRRRRRRGPSACTCWRRRTQAGAGEGRNPVPPTPPLLGHLRTHTHKCVLIRMMLRHLCHLHSQY